MEFLNTSWRRITISDRMLRWWRGHWRNLPLPRVDTVSAPAFWVPPEQFERSSTQNIRFQAGTLAWIRSESGKYVPCLAVNADEPGATAEEYDIEAAYQAARAKFDPLRSPHGAFRA